MSKRQDLTPSGWVHIWTTRFVLGARAVVYRLGGRCDFRRIYDEESGRS